MVDFSSISVSIHQLEADLAAANLVNRVAKGKSHDSKNYLHITLYHMQIHSWLKEDKSQPNNREAYRRFVLNFFVIVVQGLMEFILSP